jgi:hypothetical protein
VRSTQYEAPVELNPACYMLWTFQGKSCFTLGKKKGFTACKLLSGAAKNLLYHQLSFSFFKFIPGFRLEFQLPEWVGQ